MKNIKVNIDNLNRDLYLMVVEEPQILNELLVLEGYDPSQLEKNVVSQVKKLLFQHQVRRQAKWKPCYTCFHARFLRL